MGYQTPMLNPIEFDCTDCGCHVVSFIVDPPDPALCLSCMFLRNSIEDPAERAKIRKHLGRSD
jgi:hypothetical protein